MRQSDGVASSEGRTAWSAAVGGESRRAVETGAGRLDEGAAEASRAGSRAGVVVRESDGRGAAATFSCEDEYRPAINARKAATARRRTRRCFIKRRADACAAQGREESGKRSRKARGRDAEGFYEEARVRREWGAGGMSQEEFVRGSGGRRRVRGRQVVGTGTAETFPTGVRLSLGFPRPMNSFRPVFVGVAVG